MSSMEAGTRVPRAEVQEAFRSLRRWVRDRDWRGFDPYDGLKSRLLQGTPILRHKWGRIAVIQLCKRSPLNPRRLLRVEPGLNPKALALFLSGSVRAYRLFRWPELEEDISELARLLLERRSEGWRGAGWGYDFPWQSRVFYLPEYTPTIVVTSYAGNALLDLYNLTGEAQHLDAARDAGRFILTELNRTYDDDGEAFCWSYSPLDRTRVFNATLLGSRLLARLHDAMGEEELLGAARASVEYVVRRQRPEGEWLYGEASSQQWVDNFHTGFNLECLHDYMRYTHNDDHRYVEALERGFDFYQRRLFEKSGAPKYYADSLYPIDIHCCAQAVITGTKTAGLNGSRRLAQRVLSWTLRHMRDSGGYFYFQKRRLYTHKVPFMRWSQAWMYLALAVFLESGMADPDGRERSSPRRPPEAIDGSSGDGGEPSA